jgi:membrane complex biogenesis BtpA family protein
MIHVDALPGSPLYEGNFQKILRKAVDEARLYAEEGIDALMIENMHDIPYLNRNAGYETVAAMAVIGYEVKKTTGLPVGIQILAGANRQALAAALAADLDFIRAEGFVFAHTADEGIMQSDAGELLRYRKNIGATHIAVFTDIKKKHSSHAITSDTDITGHAKAAEFFLSDGLVVTGSETGEPADPDELIRVKKASTLPVLIGSGINPGNLPGFFLPADGFIVGSFFKKNRFWKNPPDRKNIRLMVEMLKKLKEENGM